MATPPGRPRDSLCYPNQPTTHNHRNTFPSRGDIRHSHQCRRKNREANDNGTERAYSVTTAKILSPHLPIFHQRSSSNWRRRRGNPSLMKSAGGVERSRLRVVGWLGGCLAFASVADVYIFAANCWCCSGRVLEKPLEKGKKCWRRELRRVLCWERRTIRLQIRELMNALWKKWVCK